MRSWIRSVGLLAAPVLAVAVAAAAQDKPAAAPGHHCGQAMHKGGPPMHRYDAAAEVTLKGAVGSVDRHECPMMGKEGLHLVVKTEGGDREVHLGPAAYVTEQGFSFASGDQVEVVGAPVTCCGKNAVAAREVRKDGKALTLRDATGVPKWAPAAAPQHHHPHH